MVIIVKKLCHFQLIMNVVEKKQIFNLSRLFQIGSITLNKYITNLSSFVGESTITKKRKNKIVILPLQMNIMVLMTMMLIN
jgi:hypothetical protein